MVILGVVFENLRLFDVDKVLDYLVDVEVFPPFLTVDKPGIDQNGKEVKILTGQATFLSPTERRTSLLSRIEATAGEFSGTRQKMQRRSEPW